MNLKRSCVLIVRVLKKSGDDDEFAMKHVDSIMNVTLTVFICSWLHLLNFKMNFNLVLG